MTEGEGLNLVAEAGVPLFIELLQSQPWEEVERRRRICSRFLERRSAALYAPNNYPTKTVDVALDMFCEMLAHLAFQPGGVKFGGMTWQATHSEFSGAETVD